MIVATVFRKILVPLDGSEHSQKALDCAIQIGKKFNSKITLLHVYSIAVPPVLMPEPSTLTQTGVPLPASAEVAKMVEAFRLAGNKILSDAEVQARSAELPVETLVRRRKCRAGNRQNRQRGILRPHRDRCEGNTQNQRVPNGKR